MGNESRLDEFKNWIGKELFSSLGFNEGLFEHKQEIFSIPTSDLFVEALIHYPNKPTSKYTKEEINQLILNENHKHTNQDWAVWFHVPWPDDMYMGMEPAKVGLYTFGLGTTPALEPLYYLMECERAEQFGVTFSGILANNKKWCLLLEYERDLISMHFYRP